MSRKTAAPGPAATGTNARPECARWPLGPALGRNSPLKSFRSAPARRIASTNLGAFVKSAREYFKDDPLVPIEEWEIPPSSDLATHR